jgi:hypothetical protein
MQKEIEKKAKIGRRLGNGSWIVKQDNNSSSAPGKSLLDKARTRGQNGFGSRRSRLSSACSQTAGQKTMETRMDKGAKNAVYDLNRCMTGSPRSGLQERRLPGIRNAAPHRLLHGRSGK